MLYKELATFCSKGPLLAALSSELQLLPVQLMQLPLDPWPWYCYPLQCHCCCFPCSAWAKPPATETPQNTLPLLSPLPTHRPYLNVSSSCRLLTSSVLFALTSSAWKINVPRVQCTPLSSKPRD